MVVQQVNNYCLACHELPCNSAVRATDRLFGRAFVASFRGFQMFSMQSVIFFTNKIQPSFKTKLLEIPWRHELSLRIFLEYFFKHSQLCRISQHFYYPNIYLHIANAVERVNRFTNLSLHKLYTVQSTLVTKQHVLQCDRLLRRLRYHGHSRH